MCVLCVFSPNLKGGNGCGSLGYCILPELTKSSVSSSYCSQNVSEPAGTFFFKIGMPPS